MRQGTTPESPPGATSVRFGPFRLDTQTGELYRDGLRLKLSGQAMEVLRILVGRAGQLVTREELQQQLWPEAEYGDFEHGLNAAVNRLRETLRDSASEPRYIETVPRRGYRFIGQIESGADAAIPATPVQLPLPTQRIWVYTTVVAVLLSAVCAAVFRAELMTWARHRFRSRAASRVVRFTTGGYNRRPAFSPDGKYLAYVHSDNGTQYNIVVQAIGGLGKLLLTQGVDARGPVWSPDGQSIAYWQLGGQSKELMLVPAIGGTPRKLYTTVAGGGPGVPPFGLSWSPDGRWLAFADFVAAAGANGGSRHSPPIAAIYLLSLNDLTVRQLTQPPPGIYGDNIPAFSHDGRWLAFNRAPNFMTGDLHVLELGTGRWRRLTFDAASCNDLSWSEDDRWILYGSAKGTGSMVQSALWRVSLSGGAPELVPDANFNAFQVAIANRGDRLAYVHQDVRGSIWRAALGADDSAAAVFPESDALDVQADFSPDGKRIVFNSQRSGHAAIWTADADGNHPMLLVNIDNGGTPRWSPDGRWIAYDSRPTGSSDIYVINGEGTARRVTDSKGENMTPSWSRDSRLIYFASNRTGGWQVWKIPLQGGPPVQVTSNGGVHAVESLDGKAIYFDKPKPADRAGVDIEGGIWRMPVGGGSEEIVIDASTGPRTWHWTVGRSGLYWVENADQPVGSARPPIKKYNFATKRVTIVGHAPAPVPAQNWISENVAMSPDDHWLLYSLFSNSRTDIMLVENFR